MKSDNVRQSNIEFLRIVLMFGVIVLHYCNPEIGGGRKFVYPHSLNYYSLNILVSLFVCAVNLFVLISGFFLCRSYKRNLWKTIELIIQVMIFSELVYGGKVIFGAEIFSLKKIITNLIPNNYFVILYICVFILSPYINKLLDLLTDKQIGLFLFILIAMFSIEPTIVDILSVCKGEDIIGLSFIGAYGSQWGYQIVNFILMYIIGACLRKKEYKFKDFSYCKLILYLCVVVSLITMWASIDDVTAWEYCNPLVILEACIIFIIFYNMTIKYSKTINTMAKASFTVYLLHSEAFRFIGIKKFVNKNCFVMICHIVISSIIIYIGCWIIWWLYDKVIGMLYKRIEMKVHIPEINIE